MPAGADFAPETNGTPTRRFQKRALRADLRLVSGRALRGGEIETVPPLPHEKAAVAPATRRRRRRTIKLLLDGAGWPWLALGIDVAMLLAAVAIASAGAEAAGLATEPAGWLWLYPVFAVAALAARGLHSRRRWPSVLDPVLGAFAALSIAAMACVTGATLLGSNPDMPQLLARAWFFSLLYVIGARVVLLLAQRWARAQGAIGRRTLIVGGGVVGEQVARRLREHPELGLAPVAVLEADRNGHRRDLPLPVVGRPVEMYEAALRSRAEHIIVAFPGVPDAELVPQIRRCEMAGLEVSVVPRMFESITERTQTERIGTLPMVGLHAIDPKGWRFELKYHVERCAAVLLLLICAPVMLAAAVAVKLSSPGPVLFRQRRIGCDGRSFDLLKFRSMRQAEEPVSFLPDDGLAPGGIEGVDRRTLVGRFLRRTFIDELPQLVNVIRGEMSLIGPRPERPEFVEFFGGKVERYCDRHRTKSGITGLAQVSGLRGQTSVAERVDLDNHYIENWSPLLDLKIVILTVLVILSNQKNA